MSRELISPARGNKIDVDEIKRRHEARERAATRKEMPDSKNYGSGKRDVNRELDERRENRK